MTTEPPWLTSSPSRRGQVTRSRLLQAAESRFESAGYEGASLAQIADDSGLTTGAIYQHFSGKIGLLGALVLLYDEELQQVFSGKDSLDALFEAWFEVNRRFQGTLRAVEETMSSDDSIRATFHTVRQHAADRFAEVTLANEWISEDRRVALEAFAPDADSPVWAQLITDTVGYLSLAERCGWLSLDRPEAATTLRVVLLHGMFSSGGDTLPDPDTPRPSAVRRSSRRVLAWSPAPGRIQPASSRGMATVKRIQAAANEVFAESGMSGVSMESIASRTNMRAGTAYQYFTDKEDVFRSLQAAVEDELYETSLYPADEHGRLVVAPTYVESIKAYRRNAGVYRAWRESLPTDPSQSKAWRKMFGRFLDQLTNIFEAGIDHEIVEADLDPAVAAEMFSALVQQPMYVHVLHDWYDGCDDETLARSIEVMVRGDLVTSS